LERKRNKRGKKGIVDNTLGPKHMRANRSLSVRKGIVRWWAKCHPKVKREERVP